MTFSSLKLMSFSFGDTPYTVTLNALGTEAIPWGVTSAVANMSSYGFKLRITSNEGDLATVGEGGINVIFGGDIEFTNIKVNFGEAYKFIAANGKNVTFGEGVTYGGNNNPAFYIGSGVGSKAYDNEISVNSKLPIKKFGLANEYHAVTFNNDVNITYDASSGTPDFIMSAVGFNTTYNKALNINVKSASGLNFKQADSVILGSGGYMQVINSSAKTIPASNNGLTAIPQEKLWIINNITGNSDIIKFTDTSGKYEVVLDNPEHKLIAENILTHEKTVYEYDAFNKYITLDSGIYELSIERDPVYKYYYVDPKDGIEITSGTRPTSAGSKENPVKTYADATRLIAQDNLGKIDVAVILLPTDATTLWGYDAENFACTLIVDSQNSGVNAELLHEQGMRMVLTGNTIFDNISLTSSYQYSALMLNENNFTLRENASVDVRAVYAWEIASGVTRTKDINIEVNGKLSTTKFSLASEYHNHTSTGNFNIIWDTITDFIDELIRLNNPNDGEWWDKDDIIPEEEIKLYGKAKGTYKTQDGIGIKGTKFLFESDEKSYVSTSDAKGRFDFGKILTGYYDLYILNGNEKIHTGYGSLVSEEDIVTIEVIESTSYITNEAIIPVVDENPEETYIPSGNLKGTVFTPQLEKVKDLKIVLKEIGEVITDENGVFGFADIPVGEYDLCAINKDGTEYFFRKVDIKENVNLEIKLKYNPNVEGNTETTDNGWIIWVIIASVIALLAVGVLVFFFILRKKKS